MANFQVVDYPRAYNITFGPPLLTTTIEAIFMHYFAMKIPTLKSHLVTAGLALKMAKRGIIIRKRNVNKKVVKLVSEEHHGEDTSTKVNSIDLQQAPKGNNHHDSPELI
ncbi:hypothetical protein WN944_026745 [Citrus x changshan-huyou]|uniref:Uncharacterized protein n=1 Tax=Citrus x changshan-huyou TaxID=2935761 RepID=A0AAP0QCA5_9ROSI